LLGTKYVPIGVKGVDTMLGGKGIPRESIVFIIGGPGSGKTTFAFQYLLEGIINHGEKGIYISLDESVKDAQENALSVGLDLKQYIDSNQLMFIDESPLSDVTESMKLGKVTIGKKDFTLRTLCDAIRTNVKEIGAKRLVIDPLATLLLYYPNVHERRSAVTDLVRAIASTDCTTLLISELSTSKSEREYQMEEYLSRGVILMRNISKPSGVTRAFSIEKMRGIAHDTQPRPYKIDFGGVEVFPAETLL
jgi:KaiC/GvpD/RAD55 family RecA-like ATPase